MYFKFVILSELFIYVVMTVRELMEISYLSYQKYTIWQFYCDRICDVKIKNKLSEDT